MKYIDFIKDKIPYKNSSGFHIEKSEVNSMLKPHQIDIVQWSISGGCRAIFASFGLGKSFIQLEILRIIGNHEPGSQLIIAPLGVRQEFKVDSVKLGIEIKFIRRTEEIDGPGIYITNYESVRDGKLDVNKFNAVTLDEASVLRSYGSKTFQTFLSLFEKVKYRFVATATPSPNKYKELIHYAGFLGIMDTGQALTRFFKRDSTQANNLTIYPHKEKEFWLWMSTWAMFLQKPSDLGYSDDGYNLPGLKVIYHKVVSEKAEIVDKNGQTMMFGDASLSLSDASREKKRSLPVRIEKMMEIINKSPDDHFVVWHDQEVERHAIKKALPETKDVYGSLDLEKREDRIIDFSNGKIKYLATKPVLSGSGCNFQRHCHKAIFLGIGFKFNDFIQACHRIFRFLQEYECEIHIIYADTEAGILKVLKDKWKRHDEMVDKMTDIIKKYGLSCKDMASEIERSIGVDRIEVSGSNYIVANNDCVKECKEIADNSIDHIVTSIPFSNHYEYTPSYLDFGHTDNNDHFWNQMDYLAPELYRILKPGRIYACHVKDRINFGNVTGAGLPTVSPFHMETAYHYMKHGFDYIGMITVVTDVVRENNQTYRLGWSEQCKDGSKMGVGSPEYIILLHKPQTDRTKGYADEPVKKEKGTFKFEECDQCGYRITGELSKHVHVYEPEADNYPGKPYKCPSCKKPCSFHNRRNQDEYSRARWQVDAHAFWRSSGERNLNVEELQGYPVDVLVNVFKKFSLENLYDYESHIKIGESLDLKGQLPSSFMSIAPESHHKDVWTDVNRMFTLNSSQTKRGQTNHICLARGSLVLTKDGHKEIQNIKPGDLVLTHKGRWRSVLIARKTGDNKVVTIKAQGVPGLTLTPSHKLWAKDAGGYKRQSDYARIAEPDWVKASDLSESYINLKLPPTEKPQKTDLVLWWAVGRWIADGHIDQRGSAIISVGRDKYEDFCKNIGVFGGSKPHEVTALQVRLRDPNHELRDILLRCGKVAINKKLPSEAFTLPTEQAKALLDGYLSGDGHFLEDRKRWIASSISKELLLGISILVQRVYSSISSIHAGRPDRKGKIQGREVNMKQEWALSFDMPSTRRKKQIILDDGAWKKVRSIQDSGIVETWNLKVEEDESYTAEGCIVKNCPLQFDIVDRLITRYSNPGETVFDPFGGLFTVPNRALKLGRKGRSVELNPQYFADGVKYLEALERDIETPTLFDFDKEAS